MKVGVVTVTFNSAHVVEDFLSSLTAQSHQDYTLYVVDNASTDGTCSWLSNHIPPGSVLLQNAHNAGFAEATNQGILRALADGCDAALLINNDVVFESNLLERLIEGHREHGCQIAAPLMYYHQPPNKIWAAGGSLQPRLARSLHRGSGQLDSARYASPCKISFAPFCCVLIMRSVFEQIGLLDTRYFTYAEDTDFMYRCVKADIAAWYIPEARLWHKVSSLTIPLSPFAFHYGARNKAYFLGKHFSRSYQTICNLLFPTYFLLRHLLGLETRERCRLRLRAWAEGKRLVEESRLDQAGSPSQAPPAVAPEKST